MAALGTGLVPVDETEYVIVKRLGSPVRTLLEPGLHYKWPWPLETALIFDNRLQVFEYPAPEQSKEYLTRDKKNVETAAFTCWRIERGSVLKFLETVRDRPGAETRLGDMVGAELGSALGGVDFERLISSTAPRDWDQVVAGVRAECARRASADFGIEIVELGLTRLNFPIQNRKSVFDRMRAERERIAAQYRSEGEEEAMKIRAEAQRDQEQILAEAFARAETIRGQADAEAARIYGEAYGLDPEFYRFLRTLESYEKGLDEETVLILPADSEFLRLLTDPAAFSGPVDPTAGTVPAALEPHRSNDQAPAEK